MNQLPQKILLFDGVCTLCNAWVDFVLEKDRSKQIYFASLQSDIAHQILADKYQSVIDLDSVVFCENGVFYTRSTAVLKLFKSMKGGWQFFYIFILLPKPIRDYFYKLIARNRYKWFGKKEFCRMPSADDFRILG